LDNYGYTHYYGRHKRNVLQNNVVQKSSNKQKTLQIRIDEELYNKIKHLSANLKQPESKVARDILINFFLDIAAAEWQNETQNW
jgi:hypothetical protein